MTTDPTSVVETYFDAWKNHDFERFHSILADDVSFVGALGTADGADDCTRGIEGMSKIVTSIDVLHRFVDGDDVLTWFELHTNQADVPIPTANWSHVENGKITRIRATFDPRPIVG